MILILAYILLIGELGACWIWAVSVKGESSLPELNSTEKQLVLQQLESFYIQSQYAPDGWAIISYSNVQIDSIDLIFRSEISAHQDSLNYWSGANSMLYERETSIAMGHIRIATSGISDIPNPHPWIYQDSIIFSFAHNGTIDKNLLRGLITSNGSDNSWLISNPPQTFGIQSWQNEEGWQGVVDSELIFLYIIQQIKSSGSVLEGFDSALSSLLSAGVSPWQLNIVFSDGRDLYAYGASGGLYFSETESHFSLMSSPPASISSSMLEWHSISNGELLVFRDSVLIRYPNFASISDVILNNTPTAYSVIKTYPNPFNNNVNIEYNIVGIKEPKLIIYNVLGEMVYSETIFLKTNYEGNTSWSPIGYEGNTMASGTFIVTIRGKNGYTSKKILFMK
tara:strand:+ start:13831 stop:15015 length:1185 start_codon:yes stop_codon:yes gene_type:complete